MDLYEFGRLFLNIYTACELHKLMSKLCRKISELNCRQTDIELVTYKVHNVWVRKYIYILISQFDILNFGCHIQNDKVTWKNYRYFWHLQNCISAIKFISVAGLPWKAKFLLKSSDKNFSFQVIRYPKRELQLSTKMII